MLIRLPTAKTYLPGPGRCIYCPPDAEIASRLDREHIIARKLGGQLILHQASCLSCAGKINREIETPAMKFLWLDARTHLGLPTSSPVNHLNVGVWDDVEPGLPRNIEEANFEFQRVAITSHPFRLIQAQLEPPGILSGAQPSENFQLVGMEVHVGGDQNHDPGPGKQSGHFQPFNPSVLCRMVAKIAHGAAIAEFGMDSFQPFLPDLIMGRSNYLSYYVGSSQRRGRRKETLHEVTLEISRGFVIANVGMFSTFGFRSYQAVVGKPSIALSKWNLTFP